jgi:NAD(P)-dependent dehydrogenase (short-subunit alcohol dehydrogenase family)
MTLQNSIALVTGSNRGIGRRVVVELLSRGVRKVYAGARDLSKVADLVAMGEGRVEPIALDITDGKAVIEAVRRCADLNLLINNAGVNHGAGVIASPDQRAARAEMETNYFGTMSMCRAFAPVLGKNGGGSIVNVLSVVARIGLPAMGSLSASKAAALRLTECVRAELAAQGTHVMAFIPSAVDTDMTRGWERVKKESPEDAARALVDGIEARAEEVLFGARAHYVDQLLRSDPKKLEREYAAMLPS